MPRVGGLSTFTLLALIALVALLGAVSAVPLVKTGGGGSSVFDAHGTSADFHDDHATTQQHPTAAAHPENSSPHSDAADKHHAHANVDAHAPTLPRGNQTAATTAAAANFTHAANVTHAAELIALAAAVVSKAVAAAAHAAASVVRTNPNRVIEGVPCPPQTVADYRALMPALDDLNIALGYFFSVANVFLYLPQLFTIIQRRSTFGLSVSTIVLAALSSVSSFYTVFILDFYLIYGCSVLGMHCVPYVQPFLQSCFSLSVILPMYAIALWVYARYDMHNAELAEALERDPEHSSTVHALGLPARKFYELCFLLAATAVFTGAFVLLVSAFGVCARITRFYGRVQGVLSSVFTALQWLPQIIMTLDLKERGSLNLTTLFAFATLDVASIVYLLRLKQDWSIWMQNAIDFTFVSSLTVIVLYFDSVPRHHRKAGPEDASLISEYRDASRRAAYATTAPLPPDAAVTHTTIAIPAGTVKQQRAHFEKSAGVRPKPNAGRLRSK